MTATVELVMVPLGLLDASPDQNRTVFDPDYIAGLADSIRENGVLTPIVVRRHQDRWVLVAGECRTRAARVAGLTEIPARVHEGTDHEALLGTLIENVARRDPDPIDEAQGYARALEVGAAPSAEELARMLGIRVSRLKARLALLTLGDLATDRIRAGDLKLTYAAAMVGLDANRQLLALHAYARVPTPPIDAFREQCEKWRDDQNAEGMSLLDAGAFLRVDDWAAGLEKSETSSSRSRKRLSTSGRSGGSSSRQPATCRGCRTGGWPRCSSGPVIPAGFLLDSEQREPPKLKARFQGLKASVAHS